MTLSREFLLTPFEGPWCPGFLGEAEACVGRTAGTLRRLVSLLEVHLGIVRPEGAGEQRLTAALAALRAGLAGGNAREAFGASFDADPYGTAARLLRWRDSLFWAGWDARPQGLPPRLKLAMQALGPDAQRWDEGGLAGRVRALAAHPELGRRRLFDAVLLLHPWEELSTLEKRLLDRLKAAGTAIEPWPATETPPVQKNDLGAARAKIEQGTDFTPRGDGSLMLLSGGTPFEAAEALAAWLRERGPEGVVLIAPEESRSELDQALRRHALAGIGADAVSARASVLQVLPLLLDLQWAPLNPERLLELLLLPLSPLPGRVTRPLARTLVKRPGIGHAEWGTALQEGLEAACEGLAPAEAAARRDRVLFFLPKEDGLLNAGDPLPLRRVHELCVRFRQWANRRAALEREKADPSAPPDPLKEAEIALRAAAAEQAGRLDQLAAGLGLEAIPKAQAERLVRLASVEVTVARTVMEAGGVFRVGAPEALLAPCDTVVWWDFTQEAAGRPGRPEFTAEELSHLAAAGLRFPGPGQAALRQAAGWASALCAPFRRLLCVTWDGRLAQPQRAHPLWDQITAGWSTERSAVLRITVDDLLRATDPPLHVPIESVAPLAQPGRRRHWPLSIPAALRERESYSSMDALITCPFQYAMRYKASLQESRVLQLGDALVLRGTLAHAILEEVFHGLDPIPPKARLRAVAKEKMETKLREEGLPLLQPGMEAALARFRQAVLRSAEVLGDLLRDQGLTVAEVEKEKEEKCEFGRIAGRIDMVLKRKEAKGSYILDLKYSDRGESAYIKQLSDREPVQLAFYARLLNELSAPVAYFSIGDAQVITTATRPFPGGRSVEMAPSAEETWERVVRTVQETLQSTFGRGDLLATGVSGDDPMDVGIPVIAGGLMRVDPPCPWCPYGGVCGTAWNGPAEEAEHEGDDEN
jgi:RecB family exonuclease